MNISMIGATCSFHGTGYRTAAMATPLPNSSLTRCEVVLHGYGGGEGRVVLTCDTDSGHSWRLHRVASWGHQTAGTMTCCPTQSYYPDTEPTSHCPILVMPTPPRVVFMNIHTYSYLYSAASLGYQSIQHH